MDLFDPVVMVVPDSVKNVLHSTLPNRLSGKGGYRLLRSRLGCLLSDGLFIGYACRDAMFLKEQAHVNRSM